ncbi:hypothetical protein Trydic_g11461 [Trypoxylus dichotomus]
MVTWYQKSANLKRVRDAFPINYSIKVLYSGKTSHNSFNKFKADGCSKFSQTCSANLQATEATDTGPVLLYFLKELWTKGYSKNVLQDYFSPYFDRLKIAHTNENAPYQKAQSTKNYLNSKRLLKWCCCIYPKVFEHKFNKKHMECFKKHFTLGETEQ